MEGASALVLASRTENLIAYSGEDNSFNMVTSASKYSIQR